MVFFICIYKLIQNEKNLVVRNTKLLFQGLPHWISCMSSPSHLYQTALSEDHILTDILGSCWLYKIPEADFYTSLVKPLVSFPWKTLSTFSWQLNFYLDNDVLQKKDGTTYPIILYHPHQYWSTCITCFILQLYIIFQTFMFETFVFMKWWKGFKSILLLIWMLKTIVHICKLWMLMK